MDREDRKTIKDINRLNEVSLMRRKLQRDNAPKMGAGGIASYEASDLEELRKEFYEKFTEPQYTSEGKVLFQKYPDDVWSWIVEKLEAR